MSCSLPRRCWQRPEPARRSCTVIDKKRIAELPLQARNPFSLSILVAGVNFNAQAIYPPAVRQRRARRLVDQRWAEPQQRVPLRRCAQQRQPGRQQHRVFPPAAAVQEFKIQTNSYDAQYGRTAGGVVNVSLKSGTTCCTTSSTSFNSPMYEGRDYNRNVNSTDFGRINRNIELQSNFQRFVQLGFRLIF